MYQGFYDLASGIITQQRNLNVISNNMVNVQTAGYKHDTLVKGTFDEEMLIRTGRRSKNNPTDMATASKITTAYRTYVNYEQGAFEQTDEIYDVGLNGKGFFCIQTPDGERYTRNGSYALDSEGYLILGDLGRVLGTNNQPIRIESEDLYVSSNGTIFAAPLGEDYREMGTLKIVDFADYDQLHKEDNGLISTNQATIEPLQENGGRTTVVWQMLERSNVDLIEEMTNMMASQRALQSAAQLMKMYDSIMAKSSTDVGRL